MNPFDIYLELSGLLFFRQSLFRTIILQQVVPDHNFEKMHIIVVATLLQLVVHDKLLTNHADCHLGYFLQRKILWVGFFPSFDLSLVPSVQDNISS